MSNKRFYEITEYCSFLDEETTAYGTFAEINVLGQAAPLLKFLSHDCPYSGKCQRSALDCELSISGRKMFI
nr:hypothetical protein [Clostridioides sp.]